jgi:hypothetical protein
MSGLAPKLVYFLCLATACLCAGLLLRAYLRTRARLLLWTAVSFVLLAFNNLFLVADMVIFPEIYLTPMRQVTALGAVSVLIYAFVWESER